MISKYDIIYLIVCVNCYVIGYLIGRMGSNTKDIGVFKDAKRAKQNSPIQSVVSIDETKVVTNINTDNLVKKYEELGDKTVSNDNISGSISKLKNMKQ
jgi:hypothetical protein